MTSQFLSIKLLDQGFYSYQNFFLPQKITLERLKEMIDAPKRFLVIPLIPFAIVLCFKITSLFKQSFDNIFTRFISAVLFAVPLGLSAITLQGHTFLKYVPFIIFLPLAFKYSFRKISFFKIFKAFAGSRNDEVSALRNNLFRLSLTGFISTTSRRASTLWKAPCAGR